MPRVQGTTARISLPWQLALIAIAYLGAFVLLDWLSYIRPFHGANITPWNPQPALAIALLTRRRRWLPLVFLGVLLADLGVRGAPADWPMAVASAAALSLCYAAVARALLACTDPSLFLASRRDLGRVIGVVLAGAAVCGLLYVTTIEWSGAGWQGPFIESIVKYWVGDAVGSIVVLPILLAALDARRREALRDALARPQWWPIGMSLLAVIGWTFGHADPGRMHYLYLLMVPVVWASVTMGLAGALVVGGLTQTALIVAVQIVPSQDLTVFEMQALMAALAVTGLLLGVVVDEQGRTQAELRQSLHLAAAGQMGAALAHELHQPLTALTTYAAAMRAIAHAAPALPDRRIEQITALAERIAADALRAGDIVRRLRDFFGSGGLALKSVLLREVVTEAVDSQQRRAQALGIQIRLHGVGGSDGDGDEETVWVDAVQIGIVLRNLLSNAIEAVSATAPPRTVELRLERHDREVMVEVVDSGPGIDRASLPSLFEPRNTGKPGSMGIGLSICRAIIEAHGGRLWAEPGPRGCLRFTLPAGALRADGDEHAP